MPLASCQRGEGVRIVRESCTRWPKPLQRVGHARAAAILHRIIRHGDPQGKTLRHPSRSGLAQSAAVPAEAPPRPSWRSRTPASASRPSPSPASSSASTGWTRGAPAMKEAPASASPSSSTWPSSTAARWRSRAAWGRGRRSGCGCRRGEGGQKPPRNLDPLQNAHAAAALFPSQLSRPILSALLSRHRKMRKSTHRKGAMSDSCLTATAL
jgi:hypothetical protein